VNQTVIIKAIAFYIMTSFRSQGF